MARQTEGIPKKFKNLFIVDGITEEKYFNTIFQRYKLSATEVKRISNSGNMAVIQGLSEAHGKEEAEGKTYDYYYIVIDRDELTESDYDKICRDLASQPNVQLVFSNIAFEVWLLAHYDTMTARPVDQLKDREDLKRVLGKKLGVKYKKGDTKQLYKIMAHSNHSIELPLKNTKNISRINMAYQCTNVGVILSQVIG